MSTEQDQTPENQLDMPSTDQLFVEEEDTTVASDAVEAVEEKPTDPPVEDHVEDEEKEVLEPKYLTPNYSINSGEVLMKTSINVPYIPLALPAGGFDAINSQAVAEISQEIGGSDNANPSPADMTWLLGTEQARDLQFYGGWFDESVRDPKHNWVNGVKFGDTVISARSYSGKTAPGSLKGTNAVYAVTNRLGAGTIINVPLWNSGVWLSVRTPSDSAILEMRTQITLDKVTLGRRSNGIIYSHNGVYLNRHVVNLALNHMVGNTIEEKLDNDDLLDVLSIFDLQSIAWGVASALYPRGYNYYQSCLADPAVCRHVSNGVVSIPRMHWVDDTVLTDEQKYHMASSKKVKLEKVRKYQDQFLRTVDNRLDLGNETVMYLRAPTIRETLDAGDTWVNSLEMRTSQVFAQDMSINERELYLDRVGAANTMRKFSHFVERIEMGNPNDLSGDVTTVDDRDTIDRILENLSSNPEIVSKFIDKIRQYQADMTVTICGIPNYTCPSCKKPQMEEALDETIIIPVDMVETFFTLATYRVEAIAQMPVV